MSSIHIVDNYHNLLHRMSQEFLTERLGIQPNQQEIAEFAAYIREINYKHMKNQQVNDFQVDNVVELEA